MSEKQIQILSSCTAKKITNAKYVNQKRKLVSELKAFRNYFNYANRIDFLLAQEM